MSRTRERILAFFDPSRSMALFIVGTAALTVVISAIYDSIKERAGLLGAWFLAAFLVVVAITAIMYPLARRRIVGRVGIRAELRPAPRAGLILLVSPHPGTAREAIEYHLDTLHTCWLIASQDSYSVAEELASEYADRGAEFRLGLGYVVDPEEVEDTYVVVDRIFNAEAPERNIGRDDIIADITGGLKPMTAGMALACLARDRDMQYMKAKRDERGEPDRSVPAEPVEIDTTFTLPPVPLATES